MDLPKHRRARNKKYDHSFPKGILDVIESDYTDRYDIISEDFSRMKTLFSREEWIDILAKSRRSHESDIKRLKRHKM